MNPSTAADPLHGFAARSYSSEYLAGLYHKKHAWKKLMNMTSDAGFGESVTIGVMPTLVAADVNISTGAVTALDTSVTASTVVMSHEKAVLVRLREPQIRQSKVDIKSAFAMAAGEACAESIDFELAKLLASLTENSAGSLGADLTEAYVLAAIQKLVEDNVSITDPSQLVWFLPGSQFASVKGLKDYGSYQINAGSSNTEGAADVIARVDTLYGIDVVWGNHSGMSVTAGKYGGLFHRDAIGVAISKQISPLEPQRVSGTTNYEMGASVIFGVDILDATRACLVLTK
jgi:hypothetical protein